LPGAASEQTETHALAECAKTPQKDRILSNFIKTAGLSRTLLVGINNFLEVCYEHHPSQMGANLPAARLREQWQCFLLSATQASVAHSSLLLA
jgi:hypothetical protein